MIVTAEFTIVRDDIEMPLLATGNVTRDGIDIDYVEGFEGDLTDAEIGDAQDALREEAQWT